MQQQPNYKNKSTGSDQMAVSANREGPPFTISFKRQNAWIVLIIRSVGDDWCGTPYLQIHRGMLWIWRSISWATDLWQPCYKIHCETFPFLPAISYQNERGQEQKNVRYFGTRIEVIIIFDLWWTKEKWQSPFLFVNYTDIYTCMNCKMVTKRMYP